VAADAPVGGSDRPATFRATAVNQEGEWMRQIVMVLLGFAAFGAASSTAQAQTCKVCAEQQKACMKNYAGPACKTEYQMCLKSRKSK
jgi:uncharacterized ferredoxin-like protein